GRGGTELRQEPRLREPCGIPVRHAHTELVLEASGLGTAERPQVRAIGLEHPVELREVGGLAEDQSLVATAGAEDRQARAGRRGPAVPRMTTTRSNPPRTALSTVRWMRGSPATVRKLAAVGEKMRAVCTEEGAK